MKVSILGSGIVGEIVGRGFIKLGYEVLFHDIVDKELPNFTRWKGSHHRVPFHFKYGRFTPSSTLTAMKWL